MTHPPLITTKATGGAGEPVTDWDNLNAWLLWYFDSLNEIRANQVSIMTTLASILKQENNEVKFDFTIGPVKNKD